VRTWSNRVYWGIRWTGMRSNDSTSCSFISDRRSRCRTNSANSGLLAFTFFRVAEATVKLFT